MMKELSFHARHVEVGDHLVTITLDGTFYGPRIDSVDVSDYGVVVTTVNGGRRTYTPYETVVVVRNVDYLVRPSRVYGGRVPTGGLLRTLRESYVAKYSTPFAAYLDSADDSPAVWGDVDGPGVVAWYGGRHVTHTSSTGYVEHHHLPERAVNGVHAYNLIRELFPDVAAWDDAEDAENEDALYGHDWTGGPDEVHPNGPRPVVPEAMGYVPFAVCDDGEVLCVQCVEDESNPVHTTGDADGWRVDSWGHTGEVESFTACAHCSRVIFAPDDEVGPDDVEDDDMPPADWQDYQGRLNADDF